MYKVSCPNTGPAAVYKTIQLLNELNLIDRITFDDGFARYETGSVSDREQRHRHHHLICCKCGRVFSLQEDLLEELEAKITAITGFAVVNHEVKRCGYCK